MGLPKYESFGLNTRIKCFAIEQNNKNIKFRFNINSNKRLHDWVKVDNINNFTVTEFHWYDWKVSNYS